MSPVQVRTWDSVEAWLESYGFVKTHERTPTGTIWRSKTKRHLTVPDPIDGMYPEYFWVDVYERAMEMVP